MGRLGSDLGRVFGFELVLIGVDWFGFGLSFGVVFGFGCRCLVLYASVLVCVGVSFVVFGKSLLVHIICKGSSE